jgi:hypothetical protein
MGDRVDDQRNHPSFLHLQRRIAAAVGKTKFHLYLALTVNPVETHK